MLQNLTDLMVRKLLISSLYLFRAKSFNSSSFSPIIRSSLSMQLTAQAVIFLVSTCLLLSHWHSPREQQGRTSTGVIGAHEWKMRRCTGVAKSHCLPEASFLCDKTPKRKLAQPDLVVTLVFEGMWLVRRGKEKCSKKKCSNKMLPPQLWLESELVWSWNRHSRRHKHDKLKSAPKWTESLLPRK